jgi:SAM-dependent methyltransferase
LPTVYDEFPYQSFPFHRTHPDRLGVIATLFGLTPAPADACRVLELGCASGGNIIPMADVLPGSTFLGVDLSERQIADGAALIRELGLTNIELRHADLRSLGPELGKFDYIIAHGLYSWVPPDAQEKILELCATLLSERGVALVSHHVKPGWHLRLMVAEMMRWHVGGKGTPAEQAAQARMLLQFVVQSTQDQGYREALQREVTSVMGRSDWSLFHDHLSAHIEGCFFHEFVERAERHGLNFLSDAEFGSMVPSGYDASVIETLHGLASSVVELEQYHDFVRGRTFRMTTLVPVKAGDRIQRRIRPSAIEGMWVATRGTLTAGEGEGRLFMTPDGASARMSSDQTAEALKRLDACWPAAVHIPELAAQVGTAVDDLASDLLELYSGAVVELSLGPRRCVAVAGERPEASRLARHQAVTGEPVTTLLHDSVRLAEPRRKLLRLLDGTRNRAEILGAAGEDLDLDFELATLCEYALIRR